MYTTYILHTNFGKKFMLWVGKWAISNYPDPESLYPLEYPHIVLGWVPEPLIENRSSTLWDGGRI